MSDKYAVYAKRGKYWFADNQFYSLKKAKETVKGLRINGEKAKYGKVGD